MYKRKWDKEHLGVETLARLESLQSKDRLDEFGSRDSVSSRSSSRKRLVSPRASDTSARLRRNNNNKLDMSRTTTGQNNYVNLADDVDLDMKSSSIY